MSDKDSLEVEGLAAALVAPAAVPVYPEASAADATVAPGDTGEARESDAAATEPDSGAVPAAAFNLPAGLADELIAVTICLPAVEAPAFHEEGLTDEITESTSADLVPTPEVTDETVLEQRDADQPTLAVVTSDPASEPLRAPLLERMGLERIEIGHKAAPVEPEEQKVAVQILTPPMESAATYSPICDEPAAQTNSPGTQQTAPAFVSPPVEAAIAAAVNAIVQTVRPAIAFESGPLPQTRLPPPAVAEPPPEPALQPEEPLEPPPSLPGIACSLTQAAPSLPEPDLDQTEPGGLLDAAEAQSKLEPLVPPPRHWAQRAGQLALRAAAAYAVLLLALLMFFRFVDPPGSALMVLRWAGGAGVQQSWVPIATMSPHLVRAVLVSEDWGFCNHNGIDLQAMQQAIEKAGDGIPRGASTISMQVAKNMFLWPSKSYLRKAIEVPLTVVMEVLWPKRRILEIYLNVAEWGPGIFGAEAAARHHFQKPASSLTAREAAQLAASLPNPFRRDAGDPGPQTARKAGVIQARMRIAGPVANCILPPAGGARAKSKAE